MKNYFTSMLLFSIVAVSCNSKQNEDVVTNEAEVKAKGFVNKDSIAPPIVNIITQANAPKIIPATKPELLTNPFTDNFSHLSFTNYSAANGILLKDVNISFLDRKGNLWFSTSNGIQKYDGNSFINYTIKNGLINNNARVVLEDLKGNLWIRSNNGACKYDGTYFMNFTKETGLGDSKIRAMMMDKKGDVWIGTYEGGVSKYDGNNGFTTYTTADGLVHNTVRSILEVRSGNIWFGTDSGVSKFNGKSFTNFKKKDGLVNEYVFQMLEDKNSNIWFVTIGKGLLKYDGNSFTHFTEKSGLEDVAVFTIMEDRSGILWIGTDKGIIKYDGHTFLTINDQKKIADSRINYIKEDKKRNIWFGTDGEGVIKYDGHSFQKITKADGLVSDFVYTIQEDLSGNIWLGTKDGISMLSYQQLAISKLKEDLDFGGFLFSDRSGNYWFSTSEANYMFNDSAYYDFTKVLGLKKEAVIEFLQDRKGDYWFRTYPYGLIKYDGKSIARYTEKQGLVGTEIYDIVEDSSGNIWIGTDKGLNRFDGRSFSYYSSAQGISGAYVTEMFIDKNENLWFSTNLALHKFNGTSFTYFDINKLGFNSNYIFCFNQDQSGNLWIGTDVGIIKYDGKTFTGYSSKDGLVNDRVFVIKEDTINGMLWVCTDNGLSGLLLSEINDIAGSNPRFENYNKQTGYPFGNIHSISVDKKGILWMVMDKTLVRFDYAKEKNKVPSSIQITNVSLNNENIIWHNINKNKAGSHEKDSLAILNEMMKKFDKALSVKELKIKANKYKSVRFDSISSFYPVPQNLVLTHNHSTIGFDFAAVSPFSGREVLYQYILDGYDKEWSDLSKKKSVLFGGLGSGQYTFRVKAINQSGAWSETGYPFKILPPWWLTWWAFLLYVLLLAFSFIAFSRFRSRKLRKENIKLEKKVVRRTSELKRSLEELKATQSQLIHSEKMASLGQLTAGIAHEIQNPLNFVNNFSELSKELLDEMKKEMEIGNSDEVKAISDDLIQNLEKILHHGKRADGIVKGMLQHSRTGSGKKESTDINALADEYLRLAYHGLKAKDKTLKVKIKSDYDKNIGLIKLMPQDMGRVMLNLISNAFYSVTERKKNSEQGFEPVVSVTTKKLKDKIEIAVEDNGTGIPIAIVDKIFQPFFTTKPTGQGTGLGLSLSYDIVKAHGGELKVKTKEGEGSTFIITIPTNQLL